MILPKRQSTSLCTNKALWMAIRLVIDDPGELRHTNTHTRTHTLEQFFSETADGISIKIESSRTGSDGTAKIILHLVHHILTTRVILLSYVISSECSCRCNAEKYAKQALVSSQSYYNRMRGNKPCTG